jgi:hypothetical protein
MIAIEVMSCLLAKQYSPCSSEIACRRDVVNEYFLCDCRLSFSVAKYAEAHTTSGSIISSSL